MDLCDPLPVAMTDPMLAAPQTVLTPPMVWQTRETFRDAAAVSVENILNYFRGDPATLLPGRAQSLAPQITTKSLTASCSFR